MPRYFFNLEDAREAPDTVGLALASANEARQHARTLAAEFARSGSASRVIEIVVTDDRDETIARIPGLG